MAATPPADMVSSECATSGTPQPQTQALADPFLLTLVTREERELFEQYFLKVTLCPRQSAHDWNTCVFAHVGEKGRRRDPRTFSYTGICCVSMRKDRRCVLGDACPFAHNDFEYWLHPTRYHTQLCKNGPSCQRKICFFAHEPWELRTPPVRPRVPLSTAAAAAQQQATVQGQPQGCPPNSSGRRQQQQQQQALASSASAAAEAAAAAAAAAAQRLGPTRSQDRHSRIAHVAEQVQRLLWAATNGGSLPPIASAGSGTLPGSHTKGGLPGMGASTSALQVAAEAEAGCLLSQLSGSGSLPDLSPGTGAFLPDTVAGGSGSLPGLAGSASVSDYSTAGTGAFLPDFAVGAAGSVPGLDGSAPLPDFAAVADGVLQGLLGSTSLTDLAAEAGAAFPGFCAAAGGPLAGRRPGADVAAATMPSAAFQSAQALMETASQGSSSSPTALPRQYPLQECALQGPIPASSTKFTAHLSATAPGCYQALQQQQQPQLRQQPHSCLSPPRRQHAASGRAAAEMGRSHSADAGLLKAAQALQHESPQLRQMSMPALPTPQHAAQGLAPLQQKLERWWQRQQQQQLPQQQQFRAGSHTSSGGGLDSRLNGTGTTTCHPSAPNGQLAQIVGNDTLPGTGTQAMLQAMGPDLGSLPPEDLLHLVSMLQAQGHRG